VKSCACSVVNVRPKVAEITPGIPPTNDPISSEARFSNSVVNDSGILKSTTWVVTVGGCLTFLGDEEEDIVPVMNSKKNE